MAVLWKPPPWRHIEDRAWGIADYGGCMVRGGGGGNGGGGEQSWSRGALRHLSTSESYI